MSWEFVCHMEDVLELYAEPYDRRRQGTANLFLLFKPLRGWRHGEVTERRTSLLGASG